MHRYLSKILWLVLLVSAALCKQQLFAQITVKGTVFNMSRTRPLEAVSVTSTSGKGTITDSNGNYTIVVNEKDSISFSYLGRTTVKFPVNNILTYPTFDVALHVEPVELRPLQVSPRNYHMDSLQNRKDYAKVFDFQKPKLTLTQPGQGGLGVGLDLDALIGMFQFKKNRRMLAFQKRLLQEEEDKFVDHRFTPYLVKKITHLTSPDLDSFMLAYRPSYDFTKNSSDYEYDEYIKLAAKEYKTKKIKAAGEMKKENNHDHQPHQ